MGLLNIGIGTGWRIPRPVLAAVASVPLSLDFQNNVFQAGATTVSDFTTLPGYSCTRTGAVDDVSVDGSYHSYAANAPEVVTGVGIWLRPANTNALFNSTDVVGAAWAKTGGITINTDVVAAPDGNTTGDRIRSGGSNAAECWQILTRTAVAHASVGFFKADGSGGRYPYLFMGGGANALAFFDTTNGVPATLSGAATGKASGMIPCSLAGWYLCYLLATASASSSAYGSGWSSTDAAVTCAVGVGGYVWQQQLLQAAERGPIIKTLTAAAVTVGATALTFTVANGTYTETTTFVDGTTQTRSTTVSGGLYTLPVLGTLNQSFVRKIALA